MRAIQGNIIYLRDLMNLSPLFWLSERNAIYEFLYCDRNSIKNILVDKNAFRGL